VDGGLVGLRTLEEILYQEVAEIEVTSRPADNKAPDTAKPAQRFERKFFIVPRNTGFAHTFLRQICRPDKEYPHNRVHSLYFDSDDLDQFERSAAGEFKKDKIRIRWYDSVEGQETMPVFLELKSREGFASSKQRQRFVVPSERLKPAQLAHGIVDRTVLTETLASFGHFPDSPVRPIIVISYQRYRFNEMQTGVRVSFDRDISASVVATELGRRNREIRLAGGVIEVKGPTLELPVTLRRMKLLDTDWSRFSKYGYCLDAHFSGSGSADRFWPSGRMIEI
jgi:hypothetical protein